MHNRAHIPGRALLQRCQEDRDLWRNLYLLAPYARPSTLPPLRDQDKRRLWPRPGWNRVRTPAEIPQQRAAPVGSPAKPNVKWGTRSVR